MTGFRVNRLLVGGGQTADFYALAGMDAAYPMDSLQELAEYSVLSVPEATGVSVYKEAGIDIAKPKEYGFVPGMDITYYDVVTASTENFPTFRNGPGWVIQFKATGHPDDLTWFLQFGQPVVHPFLAATYQFWVRQISKPRMVT